MAWACHRPISPAPITPARSEDGAELTSDGGIAQGAHVHSGKPPDFVAVQLDAATDRSGMVRRRDHLQHIATVLARRGRKRPARKGVERSLEDVARGDHAGLLRVSPQRATLVPRFLPRHPRDAVVDTEMRPGASMQARTDTGAPPERRAERSIRRLGADLEVLRLAF